MEYGNVDYEVKEKERTLKELFFDRSLVMTEYKIV